MEAVSLVPVVLGLLLLPVLAVLLMALCVRCRELPGSYDAAACDSLTPSSIVIKPPPTLAPWPPATSYPPVTYPLQSQPDLLPIPRSPQPPGGSHRMPSSRQDSDGANSVASYENEGASGTPAALAGRRLGPVPASADPVSSPPEAACEDADDDEDEEDYHNGRYLVVLPDSAPATGAAAPPAPVSGSPGPRDSAFSMESGEDYVNVPESEESADASLDGSREYVNVSQDLQPVARTKAAPRSSQEAEEEETPDYENLQLN
ncbi:linker for activation of T-cells family member 1 isoform X1 [Hippopotamus amphibius kiboko]|uniref:linker for activation of T-cells family member 1 isoform X1 n=1 Tax=Hippopotamus amphibius kiboko TaxID=575201 RepID=UPI002591F624|nr:linker for activation of T-cells family member 1 isoform X1 [Hippopotamus amphibius kiboko]XP_057606136.1 linker for activation of T-cells family member 1 isoform X1 [Hippopotamus amphibius kiboko]